MEYTVGIIGKPNVGKSSFFNRLIQNKKAIVEDIAGVTRDRLYEKVEYLDKSFNIIDTGGITLDNGDFNQEIKMQAEIAIEESDLVLFLVDGKLGLTNEEEVIAGILRNAKKDVIVVVNKIDNQSLLDNIYDFYRLGFDNVVPISTIHGNGVYDVLDLIYPKIEDSVVEESDNIRFSLIGRPNVGKSSLFNAIIKEKRSIVSDVEGTTRDSIDYVFEYGDKTYEIIDTAGIKKRGKIYESIDKYSVLRSIRAIEKSDVALWLIDAGIGLIEQDKRVLGYALEQNKPVIIIVNKWDLIQKDNNTQSDYVKKLKAEMTFINDAEVIFLSALTSKGVNKIIPVIDDLYEKYTKEFTTANVNAVLTDAINSKVHPTHKGRTIKFYYGTQIDSKPPKFLIFVNNKELVHFSYKRYLENYFKRAFNLNGIKIMFTFRDKKEDN